MKIRTSFVGNSSSSSFMLNLVNLTKWQRSCILNIDEVCKKLNILLDQLDWIDDWEIDIREIEGVAYFSTMMDNFDMLAFLESIGVSKSEITHI